MTSPGPAPRQGFTLIELMIAVCIIGVLASVGMPAFSRYMMTAKSSEVPLNLSTMYTGAAAYWEKPLAEKGLAASSAGHCSLRNVEAELTRPPIPPTPYARTTDWNAAPTFKAIGFAPPGPVYGCYVLIANSELPEGCSRQQADFPGGVIYIALGATDLDGDGMWGGYTMQIGLHEDNEMYRQPGLGTLADGLAAWPAFGGGGCPFCAEGYID